MALAEGQTIMAAVIAVSAVPTILWTPPANQNISLRYFSVIPLAAMAAGTTVDLKVDTKTIARLSPAQNAIAHSFVFPVQVGTNITIVGSGVVASVAYVLIGDLV